MNNTVTARASRSNQSMEVFRLLASFLVILIHIHFPGAVGSWANCIARCAVPGFFAISGFFAYGASGEKLGKRLKGLAKLTVTAFALELLWNCLLIELEGGSSIGYLRAMIPNAYETAAFLILNINPLRDALWYLPAAMEAMAALWLYVRFQEEETVDYRPFYIVGFCLFACNLSMGIMGTGTGNAASVFQYRNGLFFGLPMFAMGVFLGQHWQRIVQNFRLTNRKLIVLTVLAFALSLAEWNGFGVCDVMVGSAAAVLLLVLLMAKNPTLSVRPGMGKLIGTFGTVSTAIYVVHSPVIDFYGKFLQPRLAGYPAEPWLAPLAVMSISLVCAVFWERISTLFRKGKLG